jgi:hypoxanthine phosphoribosyltransferase
MKEIISPEELQIKIKILAKQLSDDHKDDKTPVVVVCILNGGFMFFTDFVRAMPVDLECGFMRVKSYVSKRKQGDIQITKDLEAPIKGKHVYIIDDIFDTGNTMKAVVEYLRVKKPKSLNIVTLLRREISPVFHLDCAYYNVIDIKDEWVVGYGMDDDNGHCRNYPTIYEI